MPKARVKAAEDSHTALIRQVMREMGSKGGKIGGKRRLETMTEGERRQSARNAAKARWVKTKARPSQSQ